MTNAAQTYCSGSDFEVRTERTVDMNTANDSNTVGFTFMIP